MLRRALTSLTAVVIGIFFSCQLASAQSLEDFEKKVTEFTLDNGLSFIVVERPVAPVVSFATFVNAGGANEPVGHTGLAHIFEHMAFKGTHTIGTTNWEKEKVVLDKMDKTYQRWLQEKYSTTPDSTVMETLWNQFKKLQEEAKQYVVNNEFSEIVNRNGGTGMNAGTGADQTIYFYSLPENRVELWFRLESDRFLNPVFREFYKEKKTVREERRSRYESSPFGKLREEFFNVAYTAHPYGRPVVGWHSDIEATTIEDARKFFNTYYVPGNMTIGISGDVNPENIKKLAQEYFGRLKAGPTPPPVYTKEPEQRGERRFTIQGQSQPLLLMGYHTVNNQHPDAKALELLGSILARGRTSNLYKELVENKQIALGFQLLNGWPGDKYETMFSILGAPNQEFSVDTLETAILDEIDKIKNGDVSQEALDRARTNTRADLIRGLDSNMGLARRLAYAEAQLGDWRKLFTELEALNQVTVDDITRVANKYLTKDNRTVGVITDQENKEVADANK